MTNTDLELIMAAAKNRTPITLFGVTFTPDPKPRSLRDEVADHLRLFNDPDSAPTAWLADADAVLAVVAAAVEALPSGGIHGSTPHYRRAVLDLLRGGDDA